MLFSFKGLNVRMWKKHVAKTLMTHRGPFLWSLPLSWVRLTSCHQYDSFLNSLHTLLEIKHWQGCDAHVVSKKQTNKQRGAHHSVLFKVNEGWVPLLKKNIGNHRKWGTVHENVQPSSGWQWMPGEKASETRRHGVFYIFWGIKITQYNLWVSQSVKFSIEML